MVMTSQEIAARASSFNQQIAMQQYNASIVSQMSGAHLSQGQMVEQGVGRALNIGMGVGLPVAGIGASLLGVDPMGMAMRGGSLGWGMGSMLTGGTWAGAIGGGALGAAAIGLPIAAAAGVGSYGAHQMMVGASQQQMLNSTLQANYGRLMGAHGGRGFSNGEMNDIGQQFRAMTMHTGPSGEFTTMDELGRLAANMGRMGMDTGVRNAKEFQTKFQQMIRSVKDIAQTFSTSLEEAQRVMGGMRMSGVFQGQAGFAKYMHDNAIGGNLAMSEVSAMGQLGSQLSRGIGGRGSSGAIAGVTAIGRVGSALQSNVLSEADIYNTTGLTGAEGRQAYAAQMLQGDAQFFRSSRGRHALAAIAGKGGTIDENAVASFMNGEVSISEMQGLKASHLGKVGRADFIRNEGKLRGEALRAFGGLGVASIYKGWLKGAGYGLDEDDDRSMLFLQRHTGMDDDQATNALRMVRGLDAMRDQQSTAKINDGLLRSTEMMQRHSGVAGLKHKFEEVKNQINGTAQQAGANAYQSLVQYAESVLDQWFGRANEHVYKNMAKDLRESAAGHTKSISDFGSAGAAAMYSNSAGIAGQGHTRAENWAHLNRGNFEKAGWGMPSASSMSMIGKQLDYAQGMANRFNSGGYDTVNKWLSSDAKTQLALMDHLSIGGQWSNAGAEGIVGMAGAARATMREAGIKFGGRYRTQNTNDDALLAGSVNSVLGLGINKSLPGALNSGYGAGMSPEARDFAAGYSMDKYSRGSRVASWRDWAGAGSAWDRGLESFGVYDYLQGWDKAAKSNRLAASGREAKASELEGESNSLLFSAGWKALTLGVGGLVHSQLSNEDPLRKSQNLGRVFRDDEYSGMRSALFKANTDEAQAAINKTILRKSLDLSGKTDESSLAKQTALRNMRAYSMVMRANGNGTVSPDQLAEYYRSHADSLGGFSGEKDFVQQLTGLYGSEAQKQAEDYEAYTTQLGTRARGSNQDLVTAGLRDDKGNLSGLAAKAASDKISGFDQGDKFAMIDLMKRRRSLLAKSGEGSLSQRAKTGEEVRYLESSMRGFTDKMTYDQKLQWVKQQRAMGESDLAEGLSSELDMQKRLSDVDGKGGSDTDRATRRMRLLAGSMGISKDGINNAADFLGRVSSAVDNKTLDAGAADKIKELMKSAGSLNGNNAKDRVELSRIFGDIVKAGGEGLRASERKAAAEKDPSYQILKSIEGHMANTARHTGETTNLLGDNLSRLDYTKGKQ